jgi:hypothetical protein
MMPVGMGAAAWVPCRAVLWCGHACVAQGLHKWWFLCSMVSPWTAFTAGSTCNAPESTHLTPTPTLNGSYTPELESAIEPAIYEAVAAQAGSISAEHGLGRMKATVIGYTQPPAAVELMRQIKAVLDPAGILNPYKVLPPPQSG